MEVDYFGELFFSDDGYVTLSLSNISENNRGIYTLLAANKAGVVEKNFEVKVLGNEQGSKVTKKGLKNTFCCSSPKTG